MPGGLIQSVLCDEKIQNYERIDEMFYYTMKAICNRLLWNKEVNNPISKKSLLLKQKDKDKVTNLYNRLNDYLEKLEVLFLDECTEKDAIEAWYDFFNHDYWTYDKNENRASSNNNSMVLSSHNKSIAICHDTEEFIENYFAVDIKYNISINCKITQNGFRPILLKNLLREKRFLGIKKHLEFYIEDMDKELKREEYNIYWKVKNEGAEAIKRDCIRGQIKRTNTNSIKESSDFIGKHYVECYIVKDDVCIAKASIDVPISNYNYIMG